ncbi:MULTISPECIES: hypothetical protein [Paenibacillus]|uniref:WxL domain-containing protein n=1 Tax=Paenibacillus borealis TaxID=160799 RepID=A0ABX3H350_PAEBO|nr:hypothetical protein [Paenibacillus borealis]OMD44858.1 hypothetical protein BSK56_21180 [Paenibacillus borealis]
MFKLRKVIVTVVAALILVLPTSAFASVGIQDVNEVTQVISKTLILNTETRQITAVNPEDVEAFQELINSQTTDSQARVASTGNFEGPSQVMGDLSVTVFGTTEGRTYANLTMNSSGFVGIKSWNLDVKWSNGETDHAVGTHSSPQQFAQDQSQTEYSNTGLHSVDVWGYIKDGNGEIGYLKNPIVVSFTTT